VLPPRVRAFLDRPLRIALQQCGMSQQRACIMRSLESSGLRLIAFMNSIRAVRAWPSPSAATPRL
jgi:hypothetical protein